MHTPLKLRHGERIRVKARVERFEHKRARRGRDVLTLLLADLRDAVTGEALTDHLWLPHGKWADGLAEGDRIAFDARVLTYQKGHQGYGWNVVRSGTVDWQLERPSRVQKFVGNFP